MLIPGKLRNGFAITLVAAATVTVAVGAWLFFAAFGRLTTSAAAGAVSAPAHLEQLFFVQKIALVSVLLATVLLFTCLLVLVGSDLFHRRNADEILRQLSDFLKGDWHEHEAVRSGDELEEIAAAMNRLAKHWKTAEGGAGPARDEAEEVKTRFLEIISHQLRTPLTAVRWNMESLLKGDLGAINRRQEDFLRVTNKNYQGILVMLSDWVEALEIERGRLHLNPEPIDVRALIGEILPEFKSQAKLKQLNVRASVPKNLPPVLADKLKLRYIFGKLLHNAMAYTPSGGRVAVRVKRDGKFAVVEVEDTGVGIPRQEQGEIFKKFFRASNATLMQPNASGVGLFVAKVLIEAHGGTIGLASEEGRGSIFRFTMPIDGGPAAPAPKRKLRRL